MWLEEYDTRVGMGEDFKMTSEHEWNDNVGDKKQMNTTEEYQGQAWEEEDDRTFSLSSARRCNIK